MVDYPIRCALGRNVYTGKTEPLSLGGAVIVGTEAELRETFGALVLEVAMPPGGQSVIPIKVYRAVWGDAA